MYIKTSGIDNGISVRYMHPEGVTVKCVDDGEMQYVEFRDKDFHFDNELVRCTNHGGNVYLYTGLEVKQIGRTGRGKISYAELYRLACEWLDEMRTAYDPGEIIGIVERRQRDLFV